jgi:hypothetical protein
MNNIKKKLTLGLVASFALVTATAQAFPQVTGNSYFGFNGTANDQISHQSGWVLNPSTSVASIVGPLPCDSGDSSPSATYWIFNRSGASYFVQQYALNSSTFSLTFGNGSTTVGGNTTVTSGLSLTPGVHYFHSALVQLPGTSGGITTRLYGAQCL